MKKDILKELIAEYKLGQRVSRTYIAEKYGVSETEARKYVTILNALPDISEMFQTDDELFVFSQKAKKQAQKLMDTNRIERKAFRNMARWENAVTEYAKNLIDVIEKHKFNITYPKQEQGKFGGVFHFSDTHFNELINIPNCNRYDFNVASARTAKMVSEAKKIFNSYGVKDVFVAFTGDLLNSDRRLDELLNQATNRSKATFLAVEIIVNMLNDLAQDYNVHCASVVGNESRVGKDIGFASEVVSDSYDFTIYNIVRRIMDGTGINFIGHGDLTEQVVNFFNKNILLIHGHQSQLAGRDMEKGINKLVRKYADKDINIDHILFGHIHQCLISDLFSRDSSLAGANDYSEHGLLLTSRASQNIHVVNEDNWHSFKIDLQNYGEGYDINQLMDAYNAKSASKIRENGVYIKIDTLI